MLRVLAVILAGALPAAADVSSPSGRTVECFCTDRAGARIELGETICLFVDGKAFMARCEMSLNNPMWRPTGSACLSSSLETGGAIPAPVAATSG